MFTSELQVIPGIGSLEIVVFEKTDTKEKESRKKGNTIFSQYVIEGNK